MTIMRAALKLAGKRLELDRPRVMGILNVTPDSFSDGGLWLTPGLAIEHAQKMHKAGADIIDVGGESTRPGAEEVSAGQELERVIPVIEAITSAIDLPVSVDTSKPEVMRAAAAAGAGMINDVYALRREGALETAATLNLPVCLMHMLGEPRSMQQEPAYADVVVEVEEFLVERARICQLAGIPADNIVLDPGFGFGKTLQHNLDLLRGIGRIAAHGYPVLAGLSRKSMLAKITSREVDERMAGSLALGMLAVLGGAAIIRVHDVVQTCDAMAVINAVWPGGTQAE